MLAPIKISFARFILNFSFSIVTALLSNCFSPLKAGLNEHCKCCFLVVTWSQFLHQPGSLDFLLINIALFFRLAFCFLIFLLFSSVSLCNLVLRSIYSFKDASCLNSNTLWFNCNLKFKQNIKPWWWSLILFYYLN